MGTAKFRSLPSARAFSRTPQRSAFHHLAQRLRGWGRPWCLTSRSTRTPRARGFARAPGRRLPSFVRRHTNPTMSDAPQIFRVTIQVANVEEAARFYTTLLGIAGRSVRGSRYYFECGHVLL